MHVDFLTDGSWSFRPAVMIGHTLLMSGVMNSLQPSTQTPSASIAPRLCVGSADDMYCWISVLSAGNTCKGGRLVARMSTMRRADLRSGLTDASG